MKKYFAIIRTEFQRQLTYRLDFIMFRLSNLIEISVQLIVWSAIFKKVDLVKGYTYDEMITYIVIGWLFLFLTSNFGFSENISRDINYGRLSNFLLKPIGYLRYMTVLSFARVSLAMLSGIILQAVVVAIFYKHILFPQSLIAIPLIVAMLLGGYFIQLFIAYLIGFISFWSTEINGFFRLAMIFDRFMSGAYFPLTLLPSAIASLVAFFPYAYTLYIPTQLYLGKIGLKEGIIGLGTEIVWLIILLILIKIIWKKGLRRYESVGI